MQSCSSAQGNMVGPCTCGMFHHAQTNSFSMLFSPAMPNQYCCPFEFDEEAAAAAAAMSTYDHYDPYSTTSYSSNSNVDCTLSLGTPSTRLTDDGHKRSERRRSNSSYMPNFCWDLLQTSTNAHAPPKSARNSGAGSTGNDPLFARRCANCDTTTTPLWRNGPRGPKSLCNACGIRYKKEERRAAANANSGGGAAARMAEQQQYNSNAWGYNEFRFVEEDERDTTEHNNGVPFLSWRLNVADTAGLVNDFTRY